MTNDLNRNFTKKEAWMANKPMERCAASFAIREMKKSLPPIIYQNGYKEQGWPYQVLVKMRKNYNSLLCWLEKQFSSFLKI